jgi:hypothetical protein
MDEVAQFQVRFPNKSFNVDGHEHEDVVVTQNKFC